MAVWNNARTEAVRKTFSASIAKMAQDEVIPFLRDEKESRCEGESAQSQTQKGRQQKRWLWISTVLNVVLSKACIFLVFLLAIQGNIQESIAEPYSPVNDAIEYEYRTPKGNDTMMVGKPNAAWEETMHNLLNGTLIKVSQHELDLANADSVPFTDGGFAAGLGVAHNMHCVKKLKQFLYFDHFYPGVKVGSSHYEYLQYHADHCLDFIRQSMMCHMDFSLYTLVWAPGEHGQDVIKHKNPGMQKCVNWDKVQIWMHERATSTDMLIKPP